MTIPYTVVPSPVDPEQTLRELDRLIEFNSHLLPFETVGISMSLLRRLHEGIHALRDIAVEAHEQIRELQHELQHITDGERIHEIEEAQQ